MGGCSAPNCSSQSGKKRMFRFPKAEERRRRWTINCRRDKWTPNENARLCEDHFELSQFEANRKDGWKKLRPDAVPTVFNVPNPPKPITCKRPLNQHASASAKIPRIEGASSPRRSLQSTSTHPAEPTSNTDGTGECAPDPEHPGIGEGAYIAKKCVNHHCKRYATLLENKCKVLQRHIWRLQKQVTKQKALIAGVNRIFNDDQQNALRTGKRVKKWSSQTMRTSLQLRYACRRKGYNFLRKKGFPLPSYRTLCSRLQTINFMPGVIDSFMSLLSDSSGAFKPQEKVCIMCVDEMQLQTGLQFDKSEDRMIGYVTLGNKDNLANELLVVCLRGIATSWKLVVAYHYTDDSTTGQQIWNFVKDVIKHCETAGYTILGIVSDMGAKNRSMWNHAGIKVGWQCCITKIQHPAKPEAPLFFFADVPHLIKNLRTCLFKNDIILPDHIVTREGLPSKVVSSKWLSELVAIDEKREHQLKLCPHLHRDNITLNKLNKMKVNTALQIFSLKTAAAIQIAVDDGQLSPEALSSAWFIRQCAMWFEIQNSRIRKESITPKNKQVKYKKIREFAALIQTLSINNQWKPVQTGIKLTCQSVVELCDYLLEHHKFKFMLLSRTHQDALESIFSVIRYRSGTHPNCLQARRALKLLSLAQFTVDIPGSSYASNRETFKMHLMFSPQNKANHVNAPEHECLPLPSEYLGVLSSSGMCDETESDSILNNIVYYICGYVLKEVLKTCCENCETFAVKQIINDSNHLSST